LALSIHCFTTNVTAIIDYAHNTDALDNVLKQSMYIRTKNEQLITVVGCGGNRDKQNVSIMAAIASELSDMVVLTSDNPRNEDPDANKEMEQGVVTQNLKKLVSITDRKQAIRNGMSIGIVQ
jgi:UDP-N-acetylmuramoyl-L-alanyl-D-glutamate--2,6-diaminopimelate ligase